MHAHRYRNLRYVLPAALAATVLGGGVAMAAAGGASGAHDAPAAPAPSASPRATDDPTAPTPAPSYSRSSASVTSSAHPTARGTAARSARSQADQGSSRHRGHDHADHQQGSGAAAGSGQAAKQRRLASGTPVGRESIPPSTVSARS